jgi:hypothetical protein
MSYITDKVNAGAISTSQYLTVPILNLPVSVAEKASAARPPSGGMKNVSFPFPVVCKMS